jgi:hypothetical protein
MQVQAILEGVIELKNQNIDLVEIQGTVEEVTTDKCRRAAEAVCGSFYPFVSRPMTDQTSIDQRPRARRRHMSLLQSYERPPRTLHVSHSLLHLGTP